MNSVYTKYQRLLRQSVYFILLIVLGLQSAAADVKVNTLEQSIKQQISDKAFKGIVAVKKTDKLVYAKVSDGENLVLADKAALSVAYPIASITKQITAVATLQLIDQGKLSLAQNVCHFFRSCPESWATITIEHLLRHRSGIVDYTQLTAFRDIKHQQTGPASILNLLEPAALNFTPGTTAAYSNSNYFLLGLVIEQVSLTSLTDVFEVLFKQANMSNASLGCNSSPVGHYADNSELTHTDYVNVNASWAAGGVCASATDLLNWNNNLYGQKLLSRDTMALLTDHKDGIAMGLFVDAINDNVKLFHHAGRIDGFSAELGFFPEKSLSFVVLSNIESPSAAMIKQHIISLFDQEVAAHQDLTSLTGIYQMEKKGINTKITTLNDVLYGQFPGMPPTPLRKNSHNQFAAQNLPVKVKFSLDDNGRANAIRVNFNGRMIRGKKIADIEPPAASVTVDKHDLEKLVGQYKVNKDLIVNIATKNGRLTAQAHGQPSLVLEAESQVRFFNTAIDLVIEFKTNQDNKIDHLLIFQGPVKKLAKKVKLSE